MRSLSACCATASEDSGTHLDRDKLQGVQRLYPVVLPAQQLGHLRPVAAARCIALLAV